MIRLCVAFLLSLVTVPGFPQSAAYPSKPVKLVIPYPPGGGTDITGRAMAHRLSELLGQSVVIENKPGATGMIGAASVAKSAPDGYTVLFANSSLSISPAIYKKLSYDPVRDLTAISMASSYPFALVAHPALPVKNVKEYLALAKARPGEVTYASSGVGSSQHLNAVVLQQMREGLIDLATRGGLGAFVEVAELLRVELHRLKTVERPAVIAAIAEARSHGDLSENAEYHAAREQQGFIEGRIQEIEGKLSASQVIDPSGLDAGGRVVFGSTVELEDEDTAKRVTYQIVGEDEADLKLGLINISSPIARALIGKEEGDVAVFQAPGGEKRYEIVAVSYI